MDDLDPAALRAAAERILAPRARFAPTDPPVYVGHGPPPEGDDTRVARALLRLLPDPDTPHVVPAR